MALTPLFGYSPTTRKERLTILITSVTVLHIFPLDMGSLVRFHSIRSLSKQYQPWFHISQSPYNSLPQYSDSISISSN